MKKKIEIYEGKLYYEKHIYYDRYEQVLYLDNDIIEIIFQKYRGSKIKLIIEHLEEE